MDLPFSCPQQRLADLTFYVYFGKSAESHFLRSTVQLLFTKITFARGLLTSVVWTAPRSAAGNRLLTGPTVPKNSLAESPFLSFRTHSRPLAVLLSRPRGAQAHWICLHMTQVESFLAGFPSSIHKSPSELPAFVYFATSIQMFAPSPSFLGFLSKKLFSYASSPFSGQRSENQFPYPPG